MRTQRGQSTVEYVALVALLAIVLAAAVAIAIGRAPGIANAVLGQVRRALCIVAGGACPVERRVACVVASRRDTKHVAVNIFFVRLDGDRYVLREEMSDGTVRLTLAHRGGAGVELGVGARAKVTLKGRTTGVDDELRGGGEGVLGYGETYVARDDREEATIIDALGGRVPVVGGDGPDPRERFVEGGARGLGRLGLGGLAGGVSLEGLSEAILGGRRDERSGEITVTLNAGSTGWALLGSVLVLPSGSLDRQASFALRLERHHRPIDLTLTASGLLAAGATLPAELAKLLGVRSSSFARTDLSGRRWELAAQLDLRDPDVLAAWNAFRHDPADPDAMRALAEALRARARLDGRSYAVSSTTDGVAVGAAFGARLGGEADRTIDRARLLTAVTRPPGGLWEQRSDCVKA